MSFISDGIGEDDEDVNMGILSYGPGDIKRQVEEVNTFLTTVNKDVEADVKKTGSLNFLKAWKQDNWNPWLAFYGDFKKASSVLSSFRDSTYARAEDFRKRGIAIRDNIAAKQDGEVSRTPIPQPIKTPPKRDIKVNPTFSPSLNPTVNFPWKWLVGGVVVIGVGYVGYRVFKASPQQKLMGEAA